MKTFFIALIAVLSMNFASAQTQQIGITPDEFLPYYRPQEMNMWCWATSAEMVLSYKGISLPANQIVLKVHGVIGNFPGSTIDMIRATNGTIKDNNDDFAIVSGQYVVGAPLPTVMYTNLKDKKPIILTYASGAGIGHAVVVIGASVHTNNTTGEFYFTDLVVADPYPYIPGPPVLTVPPWGPPPVWIQSTVLDPSLRFRHYQPVTLPNGALSIGPGIVQGVVLMDGAMLN